MDTRNGPNGGSPEGFGSGTAQSERRRATRRRAVAWQQMQAAPPAWALRDLYRALSRYWRRAVAFFLAAMLLVSGGLLVAPRKYTSEARLFVRLGRESVTLDPTATTGTVVGMNVTREAEINSILEVMGSRSLLEQVAEKVGLDPEPQSDLERERAITQLQREVTVWSPKNTNVIGVSTTARSPERAQQIVAALVEAYSAEHLRLNSTAGSYQFFDEQTKLIKAQLDQAAEELRQAKAEFHVTSVEARREDLQKQLNTVETAMLETQSALAASVARLASVQGQMEGLPPPLVTMLATPSGSRNAVADMRLTLYQLQTREQDLLAKYTERHPDVIAIRRQAREAERILQSEQLNRAEAVSAALLPERSNEKALAARAATLQEQQQALHGKLDDLARQEVRIKELERHLKVSETSYLTYVSSLEQTRVDQALKRNHISNINVIQPASLVWKPSSPKVGLTLAAAFCVALFGGVGLALLSDHWDHTLKTPEDIERRLGLPTLVSIPRVKTEQLVLEGGL